MHAVGGPGVDEAYSYAGYFSGNVSGTKSSVVPVEKGRRKVALYAVGAPENWFEDFGSGRLTGGAAAIKLEPEFAQTVNTGDEYHVLLTPEGECEGLYVASKTGEGFEVRELHVSNALERIGGGL